MSSAAFWEGLYAEPDYHFGTRPIAFLTGLAPRLPARGRALAVADGEGRNGVFLAECGLDVLAVDASATALRKARALARLRGVSDRYATAEVDLTTWRPPAAAFDLIAVLYVAFAPAERRAVHAGLVAALAPGGLLVLECFSPRQTAYGTGGPREADKLYDAAVLAADFGSLAIEMLEPAVVDLSAGAGERVEGAVTRLIARRPA